MRQIIFSAMVVISIGATGCCFSSSGQNAEETAKTLRRDIKNLQIIQDSYNREQKSLKAFLQKDESRDYFAAALRYKDLEKSLRDAMPLSFPAARLDKRIKGTVRIEKVHDIRMDKNKVFLRISGRGKKLKITKKIPSMYKKIVKQFIQGLEAGMTMNVEGTLLVGKKNQLRFDGITTDVSLKKNNKEFYRNQIKDAANRRIFDEPHVIRVPPVERKGQKLKLRSILPGPKTITLLYL
jgi:hypothetical protein